MIYMDIQKGTKYKGTVKNINDPDGLGRIKVQIAGFEHSFDETPWSYPASPFAGPGYGFYCLPQAGDEVLVEMAADGTWIWTGFLWTGRNPVPEEGSADDRLFKTPSGHILRFTEGGDINIENSTGSRVTLKSDGTVEVNGSTSYIVTTNSLCPYLGGPHFQGSFTEKAKG